MDYKRCGKKVLVRIDLGEEIVETLQQLCTSLGIKLGTIQGIGATNKATVGLLDVKTKQYHSKELTGDHEITCLLGNITTMQKKTYLHLHITFCNEKNQAVGGHLTSAVVSATFEGVIDVLKGEINREYDETIGINRMKL
ncbi:MAG: DNA-binding protein [Euryarchaeota archaeon]|nr:DNA-binding protein [Euryarchaeota archaeon]